MTPQEIINEARFVLLDTDPLGYRQTDIELLSYVNSGLAEAAGLAPQLFQTAGDLTCTSGLTEQTVEFVDAQRFLRVLRIKDGPTVRECDMDALDRFDPDWCTAGAGPAVNWMSASNGDPRRFYVNPKAPVGQVLEVLYVRNPKTYTINEAITDLPPTAKPALVNYVIGRSESKDDEHVNSGRAVAHMTMFRNFFAPPAPAAPSRGA